jgi:predicted ferric reductase
MVMEVTMMSTLFYWTGIVALLCQAWLTFASHSVIRYERYTREHIVVSILLTFGRNLGYEFFKATHIFAVVVFVIVFFWHCDYTLTSWLVPSAAQTSYNIGPKSVHRHYFVATAAVYIPCFVYPWLRTAFEYGFTQNAYAHLEDNGFIHLTIPAVNMKWKPGQHCFLRFTGFGLQALSSHPFTICSLPSVRSDECSDLVFYIRHGGGLTRKLYDFVQQRPGTPVPVLIDGPYGGVNMQRYNDGDRLLVIAGGSGAGWMLPIIESFCRHRSTNAAEEQNQEMTAGDAEKQAVRSHDNNYPSGPQSLRVILATRDRTSRIWFLKTLSDLLSTHLSTHASAGLDVQIYLTCAAEQTAGVSTKVADVAVSRAAASSSDNIEIKAEGNKTYIPGQEIGGRPDLPLIVHDEGMLAAEGGYSLNVFVCGPDTMQNDVRNAAAKVNLGILMGSKSGGVYLHSEHFSWA